MEAPEVPTEHLHEHIQHEAHGHQHSWLSYAAVATALMAGMAAVSSLLAGHFEADAMLEQIQASDQWAFYQAKGIKSSVVTGKIELLEAEGKSVNPKDVEKVATYKKEQEEIKKKAEELVVESRAHLARHEVLASSVTFFQVAIAVAAIAVLTKRRRFFFVSLAFSLIGLLFFLKQFFP